MQFPLQIDFISTFPDEKPFPVRRLITSLTLIIAVLLFGVKVYVPETNPLQEPLEVLEVDITTFAFPPAKQLRFIDPNKRLKSRLVC